jgi:hypothetical protein
MSTRTLSNFVRRVTMRDVANFPALIRRVYPLCSTALGQAAVFRKRRGRASSRQRRELGYRRNSGAANMKSGRSGWLSLLLAYNEPLSALNDGLMQGAGKEMVQHNLHLHVEVSRSRVCTTKRCGRVLYASGCRTASLSPTASGTCPNWKR